jgi:hypothetical protein
VGDFEGFGGPDDALPHFRIRDLLHTQAEGDVFKHRHVREQREILKDHTEAALTRF